MVKRRRRILWKRKSLMVLKVFLLLGPGEDGEEEEENSVEEEESDGTEGVPAPVEASQDTEGPTLAQSNETVSNQSEPSLLAIMQQMTQTLANLQAASSSEA
ncbi:hypothetical protein O181_004293 [Austropuccinia psidii MF-1]|uniref:Uncharacterized protein n=1 Tax=Austropuccinia psidii MF-1 TaxID=1389203 RepID=A0A9Q3BGB0_9BASI|nr:hypothetical protein [Austropuccinia psidii MF-1]